MGLFSGLKNMNNGAKSDNSQPWIELTDISQLDDIKERSSTKPQYIFKHSTRCGISRMVWQMFKKDYTLTQDEADLYFLDILKFRNISNKIASEFGVVHQSPQLIVIKAGDVVSHSSHGDINEVKVSDYVN